MANTSTALNILVTASTAAAQTKLAAVDAQMKKMQATSGMTGASMGKMGKGMAGAAAGIGAVVAVSAIAGKQLYDLGQQFDTAYDKIRVGTGATGKELRRLQADFRAVAKTVPNDLEDVGVAVADLNTRMGLTGKPLQRMATNLLNLSRMTGTDLEANVKSVARAFEDWQIPMRQQLNNLNGLYRLGQRSGASVSELADNIQKFGSPLRTLGFEFAEAASMFAVFERAGVNMQTMVPGLKLAIGNLADPTDDLAKTLDGLGVAVGKPEEGLRQIMDLLGSNSSLSKIQKINIAMDVFGKRAGADMAEAIRQGRFNLDAYLRTFREGTDTIQKTSRQTNDFSENMGIFTNKLRVALEPASRFVYEIMGDLSRILASRKADRALRTLGQVFAVTFKAIGQVFRPFVVLFREGYNTIRNVVRTVNRFFSSDVQKTWARVRDLFQSGVRTVKGTVNGLWSGIRAGVTAVKDGMVSVFSGAWDRVESVFRNGANAIVDVVNGIINVINMVPGVPDIGSVGKIGGGGNGKGWSPFQRGGMLTGGKPSGDSIPALLERGEYVLNRNAVQKVGVDKLNALNFQAASRFQTGGPIGMIGGGIVNAAKGAADTALGTLGKVVGKGAGFFIGKLPTPDIPQPFSGVGPWLIEQVKDWIKGKVKGPGDPGGPLGGFSASLTQAMALARSHGLTITSTTGGTHAPGSYHYQGRAFDASNGVDTPQMMSYFLDAAGKWGKNMLEHFYDPAGWFIKNGAKVAGAIGGHSDHVHTAMQRGGLVGMQRGGWASRVGGHWDNNELASLAHAAGMAKPGYMAQIANGESSGNPKAIGYDPGGTRGLGLWQITTSYNDDLIAKYGGEGAMLNPLKNAQAAKEILDRQGIGAWYAPPRGPRGVVNNSLAQMLRAAMGGGGGSTGPTPSQRRKSKRDDIISKLRKAVKEAKRPEQKQAALWNLVRAWAKYGDLSKGDRKQIMGGVRKASNILNPLGNIPVLQNLAGWLADNVDVSGGKENDDFLERLLKTQRKGTRRTEKRRTKLLNRIGDVDFPLSGKYGKNRRMIDVLNEKITIAETLGSSESGPGGSELTADEVKKQVNLYTRLLDAQKERRGMIARSLNYLGGVREHMAAMVKKASKRGSPLAWKLGAFKRGYNEAGKAIKGLRGDRTDLVGLTGKGGAMFDTRMRLKELGVTGTAGSDNSDLLELMREQLTVAQRNLAISQAQMPIFQQFMPKYHTGGIVAGAGEVPIMAQAGEGVFTRDQMKAMGGGNLTIVIEDGAINKDAIRVEVDGVIQQKVGKVRRTVGASR